MVTMYDVIQSFVRGLLDGYEAYWNELTMFQEMYINYFCYIGFGIFFIGFFYKLFRRIFHV